MLKKKDFKFYSSLCIAAVKSIIIISFNLIKNFYYERFRLLPSLFLGKANTCSILQPQKMLLTNCASCCRKRKKFICRKYWKAANSTRAMLMIS